jgi:sugar lactone lactonase YvrE
MVIGQGGAIYAGTLPEGRIYRIGSDGQPNEIARPDGVEHVWDLAFDSQRNVLYAATGPEGRVYAIDQQGAATIYWDSPAAHVMSLALAPDGALYAGTSDDAVVARITSATAAEIVHDFPGNEITALAFADGVLAVGANEFPDPPAVIGTPTATTPIGPTSRLPRPRPGKGRIFRVTSDGRAERVFEQDEGHITSLALLADGTIVAGTGKDGRIVRVSPDRTTATWIDVDERQVLDVSFGRGDDYFVTGDGAALYRVTDARPRSAIWESKVLDARFVSRWGQIDWRGDGQIVLQTRSGNVEAPDATWSEWSGDLARGGPIRSPHARFLQIRARFDRDPAAELRALTAYFLPQNQRTYVTEVRVEGVNKAATDLMQAERQHHVPDASTQYKLAWTVDNPDGDRIRSRLRFRQEGQRVWRDILRSDNVLTDESYPWETESVPDGWYVVSVEASDELDNPGTLTLRDTRHSEPILIDNHAPSVEQLRFANNHLTGRAIDGVGPISRLEYAVDGGDWVALFPIDDLLDTAEERFDIDLTSLVAGEHIVSVRAADAGGNLASGEAQVRR